MSSTGSPGQVDGIVSRLREELGEEATTIATGGHASAIAPFCDQIDEVDDLLTLTGLRLVWEHNRPGEPAMVVRTRSLDEPWTLGGITLSNRLVLAPLAGIGNWFVRLQAKRHGAGLTVSEMVSSFGIKYGDRTHRARVLADPSGRAPGRDAAVRPRRRGDGRRRGADRRGRRRPDRPEHGLPGAQGAEDRRGLGAARRPRQGGRDRTRGGAGERSARDGEAPLRRCAPASRAASNSRSASSRRRTSAGIAFHPRPAAVQHKGDPDYDLAARLVDELPVPVMISGGLSSDERVFEAFERTGAEAAMLARGSLGNPWRFERLLGRRSDDPSREEIAEELRWVIDACGGAPRHRPRRPLPAQVLPLVRRCDGPHQSPARPAWLQLRQQRIRARRWKG